jgi:hypothetical protein
MRDLDSGIATAPSHVGLRKCRADPRQRVGDLEGAARDAAEAVIFDPGDPQAKAILGTAMTGLGRVADAVACLAEAVAGAPRDLDYRQALSIAREKAGDTDGALLALTDGIALCPASVIVLSSLGRHDRPPLRTRRPDLVPKARHVIWRRNPAGDQIEARPRSLHPRRLRRLCGSL